MENEFTNAIRFLKAVSLLASPNGATVKGLVKTLGISRRSVFRLLNTFERLGFPLTDDKPYLKGEKTYRLANTYVLKLPNIAIPDPRLTNEEIIYILTVLDEHRQFNPLSETPTLNSTKEKLAAMIQGKRKGKAHDRHSNTKQHR